MVALSVVSKLSSQLIDHLFAHGVVVSFAKLYTSFSSLFKRLNVSFKLDIKGRMPSLDESKWFVLACCHFHKRDDVRLDD